MRLIDTDVHIHWREAGDIARYLPETWRTRFSKGTGHSERGLPVRQPFFNPLAAEGKQGWREPAELVAWMEECDVDVALLQNFNAPAVGTFGDADYPACLAEAYNRWLVDVWLAHSDRFLGAITVAPQDPALAADEIRRAGAHPRVVQVNLSAGTLQPYGKRHYRPIYEAALDRGLTVAIHAGTEGVAVSNPPSSHGYPRNLLEYRVCPVTNFIGHLTSLITEGIFTDYPALRWAGFEVGGALPLITYLWRFDKNYKALRSECPWVRELPSEVVRRHVRLGTQSSVVGDEALYFHLLESFGAEEILLWSSNAPRWDAVDPRSDPHLSREKTWKMERVAWQNAADLYGLTNEATAEA